MHEPDMEALALQDALRDQLLMQYRCRRIDRESVRVDTPFLLPNRDPVFLVVQHRDDRLVVTDDHLGLTWLASNLHSGELTPMLRGHVVSVLNCLDITFRRGELTVSCDQPGDVADAIFRVADAVVRVAELRRLIYPDAVQPLQRFDDELVSTSKRDQPLVHSAD